MDVEKIKELMLAMEERAVTRMVIKENGDFELELERRESLEISSSPFTPPPPQVHILPEQKIDDRLDRDKSQIGKSEEGLVITSPMVGTFYASQSPDGEPFIKCGDHVTEDSVVCVIEAMKVMNEVKAGKSGTVTEIFIDNGHPVEFGTKLFRII